MDATALVDNDEPRFVWKTGAFKNLTTTLSQEHREALVSYAVSVARVLVNATPATASFDGSASSARAAILRNAPFVGLQGLLGLCWGIGIPVVHLAVHPLRAKGMSAMSVRVGDRHAILLARKSRFPAEVAYYVAHELGHIALGHLGSVPAMVDVDDPLTTPDRDDKQEVGADKFALELLTGAAQPRILTDAKSYSAAALAQASLSAAAELAIEPGTIVLCFGHQNGRWDKVTAALKKIYPNGSPLGSMVNRYAMSQVRVVAISDENDRFVAGALGLDRDA